VRRRKTLKNRDYETRFKDGFEDNKDAQYDIDHKLVKAPRKKDTELLPSRKRYTVEPEPDAVHLRRKPVMKRADPADVAGNGLKKRGRKFTGGSIALHHDLEFDLLQRSNTLAVRQNREKSHAYKIKPIKGLSESCKDVLTTLSRDGDFDDRKFSKLEQKEQCIVEHYAKKMKIDHPLLNELTACKDLCERYQVAAGELRSGNNAPELVKLLLSLVEQMFTLGYVTKKQHDAVVAKYN
jgi:hypothetical protein